MNAVTDLNTYRRQRTAGSPIATVCSEPDGDDPNITWHLVVHHLRDAVQSQIDALFSDVEAYGHGGYGSTPGIGRQGGLYFAIVRTKHFGHKENNA